MQESAKDINAIRHPAVAVGLLAGFGVAYLACFLLEQFRPTFDVGLTIILLPFVVLGIVALSLWIWKPLSVRDALNFVVYLWFPFLSLYWVTFSLYWLVRV